MTFVWTLVAIQTCTFYACFSWPIRRLRCDVCVMIAMDLHVLYCVSTYGVKYFACCTFLAVQCSRQHQIVTSIDACLPKSCLLGTQRRRRSDIRKTFCGLEITIYRTFSHFDMNEFYQRISTFSIFGLRGQTKGVLGRVAILERRVQHAAPFPLIWNNPTISICHFEKSLSIWNNDTSGLTSPKLSRCGAECCTFQSTAVAMVIGGRVR